MFTNRIKQLRDSTRFSSRDLWDRWLLGRPWLGGDPNMWVWQPHLSLGLGESNLQSVLVPDQLEQNHNQLKCHQTPEPTQCIHDWGMVRLLNQEETFWTPNVKWLTWDLIFIKVWLGTSTYLPRKKPYIIREQPGSTMYLLFSERWGHPHLPWGVHALALLSFNKYLCVPYF